MGHILVHLNDLRFIGLRVASNCVLSKRESSDRRAIVLSLQYMIVRSHMFRACCG